MIEKPFKLYACHDRLTVTFDPPVLTSYWTEIWTTLATEYKLADANNASVRLAGNGSESEIQEATWNSWRPHGTKLPDSLIQKMERDIALILADQPVERTRLVDLTKMLGLAG